MSGPTFEIVEIDPDCSNYEDMLTHIQDISPELCIKMALHYFGLDDNRVTGETLSATRLTQIRETLDDYLDDYTIVYGGVTLARQEGAKSTLWGHN